MNSQSTWLSEQKRQEIESLKRRDGLTDLSLHIDMLSVADPDHLEIDFGRENEAIRRCWGGLPNRKTGLIEFSDLKPETAEKVEAYVQARDITTCYERKDHTRSPLGAQKVARTEGYERFADQTLLRGVIRGSYHGQLMNGAGVVERYMIVHQLKNEDFFRIRETLTVYEREQGQTDRSLQAAADDMKWDDMITRDGFACFGTNHGMIVDLQGEFESSPNLEATALSYSRRGQRRRLVEMTVCEQGQAETAMKMTLCQTPDLIHRAHDIYSDAGLLFGPANLDVIYNQQSGEHRPAAGIEG